MSLPQNLLLAVKHSRKFDKTVRSGIDKNSLITAANGLISYGLQLVRPHIIIDILMANNQFEVAVRLISRFDFNKKVFQSNLRSIDIERYFENTLRVFSQMQKWAMWLDFAQNLESFFFKGDGFTIEIYTKLLQSFIDEVVSQTNFNVLLTSVLSR